MSDLRTQLQTTLGSLKQRGLLRWGQIWSDLGALAELKEAPELLETLDGVATRVESVVGPFPHARS